MRNNLKELIPGQREHITCITKVTNQCNLSCPYCYNKKYSKDKRVMPLDVFERIVYNIGRHYEKGQIIFHGGEPLTAGMQWYADVFHIIKKYSREFDMNLSLGIQTNGSLITEELIHLTKENGCSLGLSFDGLSNEQTRKNTQQLLKNINLMKKHGQSPGAIFIITADNCNSLIENFEYFNMLGITPMFNVVHNATLMEERLYSSIDNEYLSEKIAEFFNYYVLRQSPKIKITYFDDMIATVMKISGKQKTMCENMDCRHRWISIDPEGHLYPCGREWPGELAMGNIREVSFLEAFASEKYTQYTNEIQMKRDTCKETCSFFEACQGGCPAVNLSNTGSLSKADNQHCVVFKRVYTHIHNYLLVEKLPVKNQMVLDMLNKEVRK